MLHVRRHHEHAKLPERKTPGAAGYDLAACDDCAIPPGERRLISTGVSIERFPDGCYGRIAPRSGLALKNGIQVMAGVIDPDYRGIVMVLLHNTEDKRSFEVKRGMRVAQLVLEKCVVAEEVQEVFAASEEETERGDGGFGSTGGTHGSP